MSHEKTKSTRSSKAGDRRGKAGKNSASPGAPKTINYRITTAAIPNPAFDKLPQEVKAQYEALRIVAPRAPKMAIPQLEELAEQHPDVPQFYNLLLVAHSTARNRASAEECIRRAFERHPSYLFARLNYAELCLSKGETSKIPDIFENKFDLRALHPDRKVFHVAEVVPFCGVMAEYFFRVGQPEAAEAHFETMRALDPKHPTTRRIHRLLHPPLLRRFLNKLP